MKIAEDQETDEPASRSYKHADDFFAVADGLATQYPRGTRGDEAKKTSTIETLVTERTRRLMEREWRVTWTLVDRWEAFRGKRMDPRVQLDIFC